MKKVLLIVLLLGNYAIAQMKQDDVTPIKEKEAAPLKMMSEYGAKDKELLDLMHFEHVDYYTIKFTGQELKSKSYTIWVKEIWDGKIKSESIVFNSKELATIGMDKVGDTILNLKVMGKLTPKNKLKISFMFPRFSNTKEYDATESTLYSLRNLAEESKLDIGFDKNFHFLAYILPYKRKDGTSSWCEVGSSGKDVENWGKKFGIKHYLLFEMKFE
jgi:hypothetical protein